MPSRRQLANAIRVLAMDAVQAAGSGHPGAPMGLADVAEVLWNDFLRHNPTNSRWDNRDRFVLSNGHASMLLYSLLHLSGYDLCLDELKNFRQLHSWTPGHPEFGLTPGVEATTGPLGQGFANAVGMALAERLLAERFNTEEYKIVDHRTYVVVGDGCLMEGISHEAASLAGTLGLGKLICIYDDNGISIDGRVDGWFSEDTAGRFHAYGWQVIPAVDGHDAEAVAEAVKDALADEAGPSLICCRTVIGFGSPNRRGKASVHGAPLGEDEISAARSELKWSFEPFVIPDSIYGAWDGRGRGRDLEASWQARFDHYEQQYPERAAEYRRCMRGELPEGLIGSLEDLLGKTQAAAGLLATRTASLQVIEEVARQLPELVGGSADLSTSTATRWSSAKQIRRGSLSGNYLCYGVREFGMTAITTGMALHGGIRPFSGTFLVFEDYARNAVRMAALTGLPNLFIYTHDSIGVGEDGPTHQPVEQLTALRTTPNLVTWRPCDASECVVAWQEALLRQDGPTALVLSRQDIRVLARNEEQLGLIRCGAYVLREAVGPLKAILIATGSEVGLADAAWNALNGAGLRVVSMPSMEQFAAQDKDYQDSVLPASVPQRIACEAGHSETWHKWVGKSGMIISIDRFGKAAPGRHLFDYFGFTVERLIEAVTAVCQRSA